MTQGDHDEVNPIVGTREKASSRGRDVKDNKNKNMSSSTNSKVARVLYRELRRSGQKVNERSTPRLAGRVVVADWCHRQSRSSLHTNKELGGLATFGEHDLWQAHHTRQFFPTSCPAPCASDGMCVLPVLIDESLAAARLCVSAVAQASREGELRDQGGSVSAPGSRGWFYAPTSCAPPLAAISDQARPDDSSSCDHCRWQPKQMLTTSSLFPVIFSSGV